MGLVVGSALVVGLQLPFAHQSAHVHLALRSLAANPSEPEPLAWPLVGSAAIDIPVLGVAESWHQDVVPIASLTKLMTAYVVLRKFPLEKGQNGPCLTISADDVLDYETEKAMGESAVIVEEGEQLCEFDLLNGMLVHSAANYADLLASMVSASPQEFVDRMNATAASLGLRHTHYGDDVGVSDDSVSTALDQARLAADLMQSPLVRSIVDQTSVDLPVAGYENSFTPYLGSDDVVGVKSGRTAAAGGCDVMAVAFRQGGRTHLAYAVVLGQQGGNLIEPAGTAALALVQSALADRYVRTFTKGTPVGDIGFGRREVPIVLARTSHLYLWRSRGSSSLRWRARHLTTSVRRGEVVGWLVVPGLRRPLAVVAQDGVAQTTLWHRIT